MLTIIMLILLALVILVIAAWWLFEIELPDVVVAGTAPAAGACIVYFYGTLLSWAIGVALFLAGCAYLIYRWRRDSEARTDDKSK
jgi:hypothetical protein